MLSFKQKEEKHEKFKKVFIRSYTCSYWFNSIIFFFIKKDDNKETDALRFKNEYSKVSDNNPFVYRNIDQIINILERELVQYIQAFLNVLGVKLMFLMQKKQLKSWYR